jgi:hypothetical protein
LGLISARNGPVFALVVTPILARHLQATLSNAKTGRLSEIYHRLSANLTALDRGADGRVTIALALIALVAVMAKPKVLGGEPIIASEVLSNRFPIAAVQFVTTNPQAINGEMFNPFGWGGFLTLAMPAHRVFVDGRDDFYGPELIRELNSVDQVHHDWDVTLKKYNVGWTILPRTHPLNALLGLRTDWSLAYEDDVTAIYARKPE